MTLYLLTHGHAFDDRSQRDSWRAAAEVIARSRRRTRRASMRLKPEQAQAVRERIRGCMGQHARIWLFVSRADDGRHGGDVDLCVEPEIAPELMACLQCKGAPAKRQGTALGRDENKLYLPMQDGDVPATYADVTALHEGGGFRPRTSSAEGIERFVQWYRDYSGRRGENIASSA